MFNLLKCVNFVLEKIKKMEYDFVIIFWFVKNILSECF